MAKLEAYAKRISKDFNINLEDHPSKKDLGAYIWQIGKNDGLTLEYWVQDEKKFEEIKFKYFEDIWHIQTDRENNKDYCLVYETSNQHMQQKIEKLCGIYQKTKTLSELIYSSLISAYNVDTNNSSVSLGKDNKIKLTKKITQKNIEELMEYFKILLS